jgi:hypothetical protein
LSEHPGFLRLYACTPLQQGTISKTPNVLTRRLLRVKKNVAIVRLEVSHMTDGQVAGLSLLRKTFGIIGIKQTVINVVFTSTTRV